MCKTRRRGPRMLDGTEVMSTKLEVVVNSGYGRRGNAAHDALTCLSLSPSCWLV